MAAAFADDIEAGDLRLVEVNFWRKDHGEGVVLEEGVGERSAEEGAVQVYLSCFRYVDLLTAGAVDFEAGCT